MVGVLDVDPFIGVQVNGPMTAQRDDIVAGDEFKIAADWVMLC